VSLVTAAAGYGTDSLVSRHAGSAPLYGGFPAVIAAPVIEYLVYERAGDFPGATGRPARRRRGRRSRPGPGTAGSGAGITPVTGRAAGTNEPLWELREK
jgi:hypothetical protein